MRRNEFEGMCSLARDGRLTWVENAGTQDKGRVVDCRLDQIEVDVAGDRRLWDWRDCTELTHGYRVNYDEVRRHPDEFDSHGD